VKNRELIPADMVMLATSEKNGLAYVMTANLDGETNLKAKEVKKEFLSMPDEVKLRVSGQRGLMTWQVMNLMNSVSGLYVQAKVVCDLPNNKLEHFEGTYILEEGEKVQPLSSRMAVPAPRGLA
jgi:magnesium-transporting ATPase (P-type)